MIESPYDIFNVFSNAEFPYPQIMMSDGQSVKLHQSAFSLYRAAPHREDRKKVFASFFGKLGEFHRTFGTQLAASVHAHLFTMRARNHTSCLESTLDTNNIPVAVYRRLIEGVQEHLPTFHRYLELRKRMLQVGELHYYDLYAPLVRSVDVTYSIEEAQELVLKSIEPLGAEYSKTIRRVFDERWIDAFPTEGKRSGAYSNAAAYDVHPYILLNFNGTYDDVSTLAHELGHTMHGYFSNKTQPYPTSRYAIFVAEVASTFNEALLNDYMLTTITDDAARLSVLGNYLENLKATVFRQTQFAEFELIIHELAERGEALTGETLNEQYMNITKKYYGHDEGVCCIDDEIKFEWTYIPHFYYNFYVFQYATSYTASALLSELVLQGDKAAVKRYMEFLSCGGSDYPIELLKKAEVDLTTSQPLEFTISKMNRVMDEMERILTVISIES